MVSACSGEDESAEDAPPQPAPDEPIRVPAPEFKLPEPYSIANWSAPGSPPANEWEKRFLAASSDETRIALLDEKGTTGPEFLAGMIRRALQRGNSEPVRIQAIESARQLEESNEVIDILSAGSSDQASVVVATLSIEVARNVGFKERVEIYRNALGSPHPAVRELAVSEFMRERNKSAFEFVFDGLADPDETVRATAKEALAKVLTQHFDTREEGLAWWQEHSDDYNVRMVLVAPPR